MTIDKLNEIIESPSTELGTTILDSLTSVPLGGIVAATYKVGVGIADYYLFRKFAHFLEPMSGMEKEVDDYIAKLSPHDQNKLGEYMLSLLSKAESSEKAQIMGMIFRAAVKREIDDMMMLRLVAIVGRSFVPDLKELPKYKEASEDFTIAANEFVNLGLIDNETGGLWKDRPTLELNDVGKTLCGILERGAWFGSSKIAAEN